MRSSSFKYLAHGEGDKWDTSGILLDESLAGPGQVANFAAMFGNTRPVEIEIGTGKGTFLLARAKARPELNFLGIEWARAYCLYAADRFRRHGMTNVRMLRADAAEFFRDCLPDNSVWRLHIYFPDPWPKTRHHRRRLVQPKFIAQVRRVLKIGGQLVIVTDHQGYFLQMRSVLQDYPGLAVCNFPKMAGEAGEMVGTNFERKYIAQGRPFYWTARVRYR